MKDNFVQNCEVEVCFLTNNQHAPQNIEWAVTFALLQKMPPPDGFAWLQKWFAFKFLTLREFEHFPYLFADIGIAISWAIFSFWCSQIL